MMILMKKKTNLTVILKEKLIKKAKSHYKKIILITKVNKLAKFHPYAPLHRRSCTAYFASNELEMSKSSKRLRKSFPKSLTSSVLLSWSEKSKPSSSFL